MPKITEIERERAGLEARLSTINDDISTGARLPECVDGCVPQSPRGHLAQHRWARPAAPDFKAKMADVEQG